MRQATRVFLRRLIWRWPACVLTATALLVGFRLYWGYRAEARLAGAIERMRAMNIRYLPEQFPDGAEISDDQNAVSPFLSGRFEAGWTRGERELIGNPLEPQGAADRAALRKLMERQQEFLERVDLAATRPRIVWPRAMFEPKWNLDLQGLTDRCKLIHKAARLAHEDNMESEAVRNLRRLMTLAHVFERSPYLVYGLLARMCRDLAAEGIFSIEKDLNLREPQVQAEAQGLIASMLDDRAAQDGVAISFEAEIAMLWRESGEFTNDSLSYSFQRPPWVTRPMWRENWSRYLEQSTALIAACRARDWPAYARLAEQIPAYPATMDRSAYLLQPAVHEDAKRMAEFYEKLLDVLVMSRAAGIVLAARLQEAARGTLPRSPGEFMPEVLPEFPADLFVEGGQAMRYRLDAGGPTVWSVHKNRVDDGADVRKDLVYGAAKPVSMPPAPATTPARGRGRR